MSFHKTSTSVVFSGGTSIAEYAGGGSASPAVEFVRGSDWGGGVGGILYSVRRGALSIDHYDGRGDVATQTDGSGTISYQAQYEAWGTRTQEFGADQDRQRANTKEEDPTGLLNEGMRYRDLETGSFITRDPLGMIDGPNLYAYVNENPWTKFDPEGLLEKTYAADVEDFANGEFLSVWHAATGTARVLLHPVNTLQGIGELAGNLVYDFNGTTSAVATSAKKGINHALNDATVSGEVFGDILQFATPFAAAKATKAAEAAEAANIANKTVEVANDANRARSVTVLESSASHLTEEVVKDGATATKGLKRPYIRKAVRKEVEARAPKTVDGKFIDPNTGEVIEGKYDLGHKPGNEFRTERAKAEAQGLTQKQFNDRMNDPDLYHIEHPSSNRSHAFEKKD